MINSNFFNEPTVTSSLRLDTRRIGHEHFLNSKFCSIDSGSESTGPGSGPPGNSPLGDLVGSISDAISGAFAGLAGQLGSLAGGYRGPGTDFFNSYYDRGVPNGYGWGSSSLSSVEPTSYYPGNQFAPNSGVYSGSLSSLGNMVAMSLSNGSYRVRIMTAGPAGGNYRNVGDIISLEEYLSDPGTVLVAIVPFCEGYFRTYYRDPTKCTFGANTAIPALTGVMPDTFTDLQGNFIYYVDLQLQRLSGTSANVTLWDNKFFLNSFNQALGWVTTSNAYLSALKKAENTTLGYYGASSFSDLITQGFDKYKPGICLTSALRNIGVLVQTIPSGMFGTPNAVLKSLLDNNLGATAKITVAVRAAGITDENIYDPIYTPVISEILKNVNNRNSLAVIQEVLHTNVKNIGSAYDYTDMYLCSGQLPIDGNFRSFESFGRDIYPKMINAIFTTGQALAELIENVEASVTANVEALSGNTTTLISQSIIDDLRSQLPLGKDQGPVSLINVIGMASGYIIEGVRSVNRAIARLYATDYGIQLRDVLSEISRFRGRHPLSQSEINTANAFVPVNGQDYWEVKLQEKKTQYLNLVNIIANDTSGEMPAIVEQINSNYLWCCQNLYWENKNWTKANISIDTYSDNSQYWNFVSSMQYYAEDPQDVGTDYMLYGISQPNTAGEVARTVLALAKNNQILANAGSRITGLL